MDIKTDMWKESYRLGVEGIDAQHKMLFDKVGELIQEIQGAQRPEIYRETIAFLQKYVVEHFRDEEAYLYAMHYADEEGHRAQHQELTQQVERFTVELEQTDYAPYMVKRLAGMLGAWLIYHVVREDLKYTDCAKEDARLEESSYLELFASSAAQVLEVMVGLNPLEIDRAKTYHELSSADVFVEIELVGNLKGRVIYGFTREFAMGLVESMMSFTPEEMDDLVCSALAEVSNIATGKGTIAISEQGIPCDIRPPKVFQQADEALSPREGMKLGTKLGKMTVSVYLD